MKIDSLGLHDKQADQLRDATQPKRKQVLAGSYTLPDNRDDNNKVKRFATTVAEEKSREVRQAIRRVFVEMWDPIRVMDDPTWPRDEYDGYIGPIFELLTTGGSDQDIEGYLLDAARHIGMDGSRNSLATVIADLRKIDLNGFPRTD